MHYTVAMLTLHVLRCVLLSNMMSFVITVYNCVYFQGDYLIWVTEVIKFHETDLIAMGTVLNSNCLKKMVFK